MQKFLLLRNNKQTGPYSVEELEQMGLKPYDLIWVNGKSAAWRYPGEVDDLKSFAPPVEEQPYDRFYKKPNEDS
ncbi:MAG TPA: GYF domain-containing protein, partial [Chitinophagaceae bacterium]|nr:GYF domain-containing protein [Chitinophagaceae bacterium]